MTMIAQDAPAQAETQVKRAKPVSPELAEFLHMLDALDNQLCGRRFQ